MKNFVADEIFSHVADIQNSECGDNFRVFFFNSAKDTLCGFVALSDTVLIRQACLCKYETELSIY